MVGLIDDEKHITTQWFKDEGDVIILVGAVAGSCPRPKSINTKRGNARGYKPRRLALSEGVPRIKNRSAAARRSHT